jgi:hypothetical protein
VTFRTRHEVAELVVAFRAPFPTLEPHSAMVVERRMAGGARQIRRLNVRAVRERPSQPLRSLGLDAEVTTQTYVFTDGRTDIHRRDVEIDSAHRSGLIDEVE